MKKFTQRFLKEVLQFNEEETKLTMKAQREFPKLLDLENYNSKDFIIDGEKLCNQLGVKDNFNTWLLRTTKGKEGKLIKYRCIENTDFINDWISPNVNFSKEEITNMNNQQRSRNGIKNVIKLTINCAKKIAMRQNNEQGDLVCDYFILMEKAVIGLQNHLEIREPEKKGYKELCKSIEIWAENNLKDYDLDGLCQREANMLNQNLLHMKASEIQMKLGYKDRETREHLEIEINKALYNLQIVDCSLLMANLDFETRSRIIKDTCNTKYSDLYIK